MSEEKLNTISITDSFQPLEALLVPKANPENTLEYAWHYIQVYAAWGLRLPSDEVDYKLLLNTEAPAGFLFYENMLKGTSEIKTACSSFMTDTLPKIIQVGNDLSSFANNASNDDGEMFKIIIELLDDDPESALDLITDLQSDAKKALKNADDVQSKLGTFKTSLISANKSIGLAQTKIEEDSATNTATINELSTGDLSIEKMRENKERMTKHYGEAVAVAATTPTYSWVLIPPPLPGGLVAGITLAIIYGSKAVQLLKDIKENEDNIRKANNDLARAISAQETVVLAHQAVTNIDKYTRIAILHTTTVQNGWNSISKGLIEVSKEINRTTSETDEGEKLRRTKLVKTFLNRTEEQWRLLAPALNKLTEAPYIHVEPQSKTIDELTEEVQMALEEIKKAS